MEQAMSSFPEVGGYFFVVTLAVVLFAGLYVARHLMGRYLKPHVFLSYRRADQERENVADRLYTDLVNEYEPDNVFMDVYGIRDGESFPPVLKHQLKKSNTIVAIIGEG